MTLEGLGAFAALATQLREGIPCPPLNEPCFERLRRALSDPRATALDRALLLRHALRFQSLTQTEPATVLTGAISEEEARQVGLTIKQRDDNKLRMIAAPWDPGWLAHSTTQSVDFTAMKAPRQRFFPEEVVSGDPFLLPLAHKGYRSIGQRAAVRAALAMPPGSRLVIDLPTGEGKSTVFSLIDAVGFSDEPPGSQRGTTLVIVPTVTLALDHERTCKGSDDHPLAYIGGRIERNQKIQTAITNGLQGLCFAAPEAACGPLRHALSIAAEQGTLRAVVVDEAHLIEGWGTGFRTDFQTFAGLANSWREVAPQGRQFRTVMLSATLTAEAEQTLHDFFAADDDALTVVGAARTRPELEFWVAPLCDENDRRHRVLDAVLHLPRPAILYVTKVQDAEDWYGFLRQFGFGRIEKVHGQSGSEDRERVLAGWSDGSIDLVVATSAFGLGVDYPHVRTVLHACIPETFDRFYQEAGRAGRDGCSAISLIIPTWSDRSIARSLAMKTVITTARGLTRWRAMFDHPEVVRLGHPSYGVRLDTAPGTSPEDIDMIGERSIDWNARTLALMARSGLIRLKGIPAPKFDPNTENSPGSFQNIDVIDERHLEPAVWGQRVEPKRAAIAAASERSLNLMSRFLQANECPGRLVSELYASTNRSVASGCGGCTLCREDPKKRTGEGLVGERPPPWPVQAKLSQLIEGLWGPSRRLLIEYPRVQPPNRMLLDFRDAIRRLDGGGLRLFMSIASPPAWIAASVSTVVETRPWFTITDSGWFPARWPRGACFAAFGADARLDVSQLLPNASDAGAIFLVPKDLPDATSSHRHLADVVPWPILDLDGFLGKVLR